MARIVSLAIVSALARTNHPSNCAAAVYRQPRASIYAHTLVYNNNIVSDIYLYRLSEYVSELSAASKEMASEIVGDGNSFTLESYIRGHHVYHTVWTPIINKVLPVKRELTNDFDRFAVAVLKGGEVVGHVPRTLSKTSSFFLRYDGSKDLLQSYR